MPAIIAKPAKETNKIVPIHSINPADTSDHLPITFTIFPRVTGNDGSRKVGTWGMFCDTITQAKAYKDKLDQPLFRMATYPGDSKRSGHRPEDVFGIEVDYDECVLSIAEASVRLEASGIAGLFYSSYSATDTTHKWRCVVPFQEPKTLADRNSYLAVVDAVLSGQAVDTIQWLDAINSQRIVGGIASEESYRPTQNYFYGRNPANEYVTRKISGKPVDAIILYTDTASTLRIASAAAASAHNNSARGEYDTSVAECDAEWAASDDKFSKQYKGCLSAIRYWTLAVAPRDVLVDLIGCTEVGANRLRHPNSTNAQGTGGIVLFDSYSHKKVFYSHHSQQTFAVESQRVHSSFDALVAFFHEQGDASPQDAAVKYAANHLAVSIAADGSHTVTYCDPSDTLADNECTLHSYNMMVAHTGDVDGILSVEAFLTKAAAVTPETVDKFLRRLARYVHNSYIKPLDIERILDAFVKTGAGRKPAITKALRVAVGDIRLAELSVSDEEVDGTFGRYIIQSGNLMVVKTDAKGEVTCSPVSKALTVTAETFDADESENGVRLEWYDSQNRHKTWAMPLSMLAEDAKEIERELRRGGLNIESDRAKLLKDYINAKHRSGGLPLKTCVAGIGWVDGAFATPDRTYGSDNVLFQSRGAMPRHLMSRGDLAEWRERVGVQASGNSRALFAVSMAFAGTLLEASGVETAGVHFYGGTGDGKTTLARMAVSVWGTVKDAVGGIQPFERDWKGTGNGFEAVAAMHNDGLMVLDEIKSASSKEVGDIVYKLTNGVGKTRMNNKIQAEAVKVWKVMLLSTGELTLEQYMADTGSKSYAGQIQRLANVQSGAGANMGVWENIHCADSPAVFANAINDAVRQTYGVAGVAWLEALVDADRGIPSDLTARVDALVKHMISPEASNQVQRVARRFALVGVAGEIATTFGITGWGATEAHDAAITCFNDWVEGFGGMDGKSRESRMAVENLERFLATHAARFQDWTSSYTPRDRVGFIRRLDDEIEYVIIKSEIQMITGCSEDVAVKALRDAGKLYTGTDGKSTQSRRPPGLPKGRHYCIRIESASSSPFDDIPDVEEEIDLLS